MGTTGSSSSIATADVDGATVDLVVGVVSPEASAVDATAFVHDLGASLARLASTLRWRLAVAHTGADNDAQLQRFREVARGEGAFTTVNYVSQPSDALDIPYHGVPGRARVLRALLLSAQEAGARACVIVDPRSSSPAAWLERLVQPLVADQADYVAPVYSRHPFAGALIHGVVYPTFRALYGARLRFPMATDFGCSPRLIEAVLPEPIWDTSAGQLGIDLWLAVAAVSNGFRVAQAGLGPRLDERSGLDLSTTVSQVVGGLFSGMDTRASDWQRIRGSRSLPQIGEPFPVPQPPDVNVAALADSFRLGARELQDIWADVLPPLAILQWRRLAVAPLEAFRVDDALWARTVYDFAVGHRRHVIARDHLLRALTPLYLGWLASFVLDARQGPLDQAEARLERLCQAFEAEKPYLISQWRWPDRFRPVKLRRASPPPSS